MIQHDCVKLPWYNAVVVKSDSEGPKLCRTQARFSAVHQNVFIHFGYQGNLSF
jgi:hypothetical protein